MQVCLEELETLGERYEAAVKEALADDSRDFGTVLHEALKSIAVFSEDAASYLKSLPS